MPNETATCDYCHRKLRVDSPVDRVHLMRHCAAVNAVASPIVDPYPNLTRIGRRLAGVTRVRRILPSVRFTADRKVP